MQTTAEREMVESPSPPEPNRSRALLTPPGDVNLAETLLSMVGSARRSALLLRLRAVRAHCAEELLVFTDPPDDAAHAAFRMLPEVTNGSDTSAEDRARLRPLAANLLRAHAALLGIEDPDGLLALVK